MPRPRKNGSAPAQTIRRRLTDRIIRSAAPSDRRLIIWDTDIPKLGLAIEPSGQKAFKVVYSHRGRARWLNIGPAADLSLSQARRIAREMVAEIYLGRDPQGERAKRRDSMSLAELVQRYLDDPKVQQKKRSLPQSAACLGTHVLPLWGKRAARDIQRREVLELHRQKTRASGSGAANSIVATLSAVFAWGMDQELVEDTPCRRIPYNQIDSRQRVLEVRELGRFWHALDDYGPCEAAALKVLLLCGQRPGEVEHMRWEHISDRWWTLPGKPDPARGWPGTKNNRDHRVWLAAPAWAILQDIGLHKEGFVFATKRGKACYAMKTVMRELSEKLPLNPRVRPHDLRRTHGTTITRLGFGRDAMNRIQNHVEGGIADIYDRYKYEAENRQIQEAVAVEFLTLAAAPPAVAA